MDFIYAIDKAITDFIHFGLQNEIFDFLMPLITRLGDIGFIWIIISVVLVLTKKYRRIGFTCILALILSTILTEGILKHLVERTRPLIVNPIETPLIPIPVTFSFPSGHTGASVAVAFVLCKYLPRYKLGFITLAFLIAFSRIYLYVHYFFDVIGGVIVGITSGVLAIYIIEKWIFRKDKEKLTNI